jgi:hypothetical protein
MSNSVKESTPNERPRITLSRSQQGELEIWVNEAGRDLLVRELQHLSEASDHFHFGPEDLDGEVPVQSKAYRPDDEIFEWGKVLFRPDKWDAAYYPHVLGSAPKPEEP